METKPMASNESVAAELRKVQADWYKDHARMTSNQGWQNGVD